MSSFFGLILKNITDLLKLAQILIIESRFRMIVGFNHNVKYKNISFHVQTEDSGVKSPHIVTLLYNHGTIVSSIKSSYASQLSQDNLSEIVEELAKAQHTIMMKQLKAGDFDEKLTRYKILKDSDAKTPVVTASAPFPTTKVKQPTTPEKVAVASPVVKKLSSSKRLGVNLEVSDQTFLNEFNDAVEKFSDAPEVDLADVSDIDKVVLEGLFDAEAKEKAKDGTENLDDMILSFINGE